MLGFSSLLEVTFPAGCGLNVALGHGTHAVELPFGATEPRGHAVQLVAEGAAE